MSYAQQRRAAGTFSKPSTSGGTTDNSMKDLASMAKGRQTAGCNPKYKGTPITTKK